MTTRKLPRHQITANSAGRRRFIAIQKRFAARRKRKCLKTYVDGRKVLQSSYLQRKYDDGLLAHALEVSQADEDLIEEEEGA